MERWLVSPVWCRSSLKFEQSIIQAPWFDDFCHDDAFLLCEGKGSLMTVCEVVHPWLKAAATEAVVGETRKDESEKMKISIFFFMAT